MLRLLRHTYPFFLFTESSIWEERDDHDMYSWCLPSLRLTKSVSLSPTFGGWIGVVLFNKDSFLKKAHSFCMKECPPSLIWIKWQLDLRYSSFHVKAKSWVVCEEEIKVGMRFTSELTCVRLTVQFFGLHSTIDYLNRRVNCC